MAAVRSGAYKGAATTAPAPYARRAPLSPRELVAYEDFAVRGPDALKNALGLSLGKPAVCARLWMKLASARARDHLALAATRAEIIERNAATKPAPIYCGKQREVA